MTLRKLINSNRGRFAIIFALLVMTQVIDVASTYLFSPMVNQVSAGRFNIFCSLLLIQFALALVLNLAFNGANYLFSKQPSSICTASEIDWLTTITSSLQASPR